MYTNNQLYFQNVNIILQIYNYKWYTLWTLVNRHTWLNFGGSRLV